MRVYTYHWIDLRRVVLRCVVGVDEIHTSEFMDTPHEAGASASDGVDGNNECLGCWAGSWGGVSVGKGRGRKPVVNPGGSAEGVYK